MRSAAAGERRTGEYPAERTLDVDEKCKCSVARGGLGFLTPPPVTRRARGLGRSPKVRVRPEPAIGQLGAYVGNEPEPAIHRFQKTLT